MSISTSGYSKTPLAKKLGIKDGFNIRLISQPSYYMELFDDFPKQVELLEKNSIRKDIIHYFVTEANDLYRDLPVLKTEIKTNGSIWVSWPKKASKVNTDITEDTIRNLALSIGLVDIKVCAVDEVWSGLKLVIPLKYRIPDSTL